MSSYVIVNSLWEIYNQSTDFLPLQDWGRSWQGFWLCVHSCWRQLIVLLSQKFISSSFTNTSFVDFWPIYFAFSGSAFIDIETCPQVWLEISVGHIKIGHTDLLPMQACGRSWWGCQFCYLLVIINWLTFCKAII